MNPCAWSLEEFGRKSLRADGTSLEITQTQQLRNEEREILTNDVRSGEKKKIQVWRHCRCRLWPGMLLLLDGSQHVSS